MYPRQTGRISLACALAFALILAHAQQPSRQQNHGIVVADMDRSVRAGDDFFHYANGAWIQRTEIPPDRGGVSAFVVLDQVSEKRTSGLIEEIVKSHASAGTRKIADLYHSYMDEATIEAKGLSQLKPHLDAIAAIQDKQELAGVLGEGLRADEDPLNNTNFHSTNLFGLWVAPDFTGSEHYTAYLLEGGLELPDRDYYLSDNEHMRSLRADYVKHIAAMLKLAGFSESEARAQRIFELEHAIAEKHWDLAEDQDVHKANNPWKRADFVSQAPGLDWTKYFRAAGLANQENFIVWQPSAFTGESALVASTPLEIWKDWLAYHFIEDSSGSLSKGRSVAGSYAGGLPKAFADQQFEFFGKVVFGVPQRSPRWQQAVGLVDETLGDEVGKVYAQGYFPPAAKARAQKMVANIVEAFHKRIDALDWMTPATKTEAQAKLSALYVGVGYTEHWEDYSALEIKPDDLFGNIRRASLFEYHRQTARLGKPVDRQEWAMTPQTVNAVNLPLQNALNFPAAILNPPFFDPDAPNAANYGAIGVIIGHEISHTFDSEGSAFDAHGGLRNWWTPADLDHFNAATKKLADQYSSYCPFADLCLNGQQTLAENIADLGGVAASYDGYRAALGNNTAPSVDGFSGDQQFFIAYGQSERSKTRDAALRRQVMTDEHSPGQYRTLTVRNDDAWYKAFNVQPGEKLYLAPDERVRIW